jgi:hypothetical protein
MTGGVCGAAAGFGAAAKYTYHAVNEDTAKANKRINKMGAANYYGVSLVTGGMYFCFAGFMLTGLGFMLGCATAATLPVTLPCVVMHAMSIPARKAHDDGTVSSTT